MANYTGTAGDDSEIGTPGDDTFDMTQGGNDTVLGGAGDDVMSFGATFTAADSIDGGDGTDLVDISGNYTGANALAFTATTMVNVESLWLEAGNSYDITINDATIAAGRFMTVDGQLLGAGDSMTVNASAETNGRISFYGSSGLNVLTGGAGNDAFYFTYSTFSAADRIDGGGGYNYIYLRGDYSSGLVFDPTTMVNVQQLIVDGAYIYNLVLDDANLSPASGFTFLVNDAVDAGGGLILDASTETDTSLEVYGGLGLDIITGGAKTDYFYFIDAPLTAGDRLDGGGGGDLLYLSGDYSAGLKFSRATMVNIETLRVGAGFNYVLKLNDANVAAGQTLAIDTSQLGAGDSMSLDGSAESNGKINYGGGAGYDTLAGTAANLLGGLKMNGGSGTSIDRLNLTTVATLAATDFSRISHIEQLGLANGGNSVSVSDALVGSADDGHLLTIFGGSGDDMVSATNVTHATYKVTFVSGTGNDTLTGGIESDAFTFSASGLTSGDTVNGGAGTAIDAVVINTGGTMAADAFAHVTHIEQIQLTGSGTHTLTVSDAVVASADDGPVLTVLGSASTDVVDASGVTNAANAVIFNSGSGSDTLTGGAGADTFGFAGTDLGIGDSVNGGTGASIDRLVLTSATSLASFATISHIEEIHLANGNNALTLSDAMVGSADDGRLLAVFGGTGNDIISASLVTAANRVSFLSGSGNDSLTGGAGADSFTFATIDLTSGDQVNGGSGASPDTLVISTAGTVAATALQHVAHVEVIQLGTGDHIVTLTNALVTSADDAGLLTVVGNSGIDVIDASAVSPAPAPFGGSVDFQGGRGADVLTSGGNADVFSYASAAESTGNSTGTAYDTLIHFDAAADRIDLPNTFAVGAVITVTGGSLSTASFDTDMAAAISASLGAHQSVLFHANSGSLAGHDFLVVNPKGSAGYISGSDYVFDVTGYSGTIGTTDFI